MSSHSNKHMPVESSRSSSSSKDTRAYMGPRREEGTVMANQLPPPSSRQSSRSEMHADHASRPSALSRIAETNAGRPSRAFAPPPSNDIRDGPSRRPSAVDSVRDDRTLRPATAAGQSTSRRDPPPPTFRGSERNEARAERSATLDRGTAIASSRARGGHMEPYVAPLQQPSRASSQRAGDTMRRESSRHEGNGARADRLATMDRGTAIAGSRTRGNPTQPYAAPLPSSRGGGEMVRREPSYRESSRGESSRPVSSREVARVQPQNGTVTQIGQVQQIHNQDINQLAQRVESLEIDKNEAEQRAAKCEQLAKERMFDLKDMQEELRRAARRTPPVEKVYIKKDININVNWPYY